MILRVYFLLVLQVSTTVASPLVSNLIEPVNYFTGRIHELEKLDTFLLKYKKSSIVGLSGIGKSQLARMYAFKKSSNYKIIWFFDCNSDLGRQFSNLARAINLKLNDNELLAEDEKAKASVLNYIVSRNDILIIFDNLKLNQNIKISDMVDLNHNSHVLFCSQDANNLPHVVRLSNLDRVDSLNLLNNIIIGRSDEEKHALLTILNGYPSLISQASFLLNSNKYITVKDYKDIFPGEQKKLFKHMNIVLQNLSSPSKNLLYKLVLLNNKFSRDCINRFNEDTSINSLKELIRFGLINDRGKIGNAQIFEIHDTINDALLENMTQISETIKSLILTLQKSLPKSSLERYKLFLEDNTLLDNIEKLEQNAIAYKLPFHNILGLTRHRLVFYQFGRYYSRLVEIKEWFESHEKKSPFHTFSNLSERVSYSECVFQLGLTKVVFRDRESGNEKEALQRYHLALKTIKKVSGELDLKSSIYGQLAQYYIYIGDLDNTNKYLQYMLSLKEENPSVYVPLRLYYMVKAKMLLQLGKYKESLELIKYCIDESTEKKWSKDTFFSVSYLHQAKIYNRMQNYKKALAISKKICEEQKFKESGWLAQALIELSHAELGLNNNKHLAVSACNHKYKFQQSRIEFG